jgi:hypothetical protein
LGAAGAGRHRSGMNVSDDGLLRLEGLNEFSWDVGATHQHRVAVSVKDGAVTLLGCVLYTGRLDAAEIAERAPGVRPVIAVWS